MKSSKPSAPHRSPPVESRWGRWRRLALIGLMGCSLLATVAVAVVIGIYSQMAKKYDLTQLGKMPERTMVMDSQGELLGRMYGENRIVVPFSQV